jgi:hypothetical protein
MPIIMLRQAGPDDLNNILQLFRETIETSMPGIIRLSRLRPGRRERIKEKNGSKKLLLNIS